MSDESVCRESVKVGNENGLHLVPCSRIARLARRFEDCEVRIVRPDSNQVVDAKNVFDLITLKAQKDTVLEIEARGAAARQAVDEMVRLFERNFETDEDDEEMA